MATQNVNQGASQEAKPQSQKQQQATPPPKEERRESSGIARREPTLPSLFGAGLPLSPFGFMRRMMEDMDRMFEQLQTGGGSIQQERARLWSPQVEVLERDGNLLVRADLPGLRQEDVRVELLGDTLILEGERRVEREEERGGMWRSERSYGTFRRAIPLPEEVDVENAEARFENGVLEVSLKLQRQRQSKRIEVKGAKPEEKSPVH